MIAQKRGVKRQYWPGEFISENGPGAPPTVGSFLTIYFKREAKNLQKGFYYAFGETADYTGSAFDVVRYYCNISEQGAAMLIEHVTSRFNKYQVPFRLKCANRSTMFNRVDTAVLYVNRKHYRIVAILLAELYPKLRPFLGEDIPILTRRVARGIAFAEEPSSHDSFGMSRSRLIAEGLWFAYTGGEDSTDGKLTAVKKCFSDYGLNVTQPYLREGSVGYYEFPIFD